MILDSFCKTVNFRRILNGSGNFRMDLILDLGVWCHDVPCSRRAHAISPRTVQKLCPKALLVSLFHVSFKGNATDLTNNMS